MTHPILTLAAVAALSAAQGAQGAQTLTGTITDDMCAGGGHSQMRMGPTDAECAIACITGHDARYVLDAGDTIYALSDQRTPERFAAQKVAVRGTLDPKTRTILVDSITASDEP